MEHRANLILFDKEKLIVSIPCSFVQEKPLPFCSLDPGFPNNLVFHSLTENVDQFEVQIAF